jgi:hypothetical protein
MLVRPKNNEWSLANAYDAKGLDFRISRRFEKHGLDHHEFEFVLQSNMGVSWK